MDLREVMIAATLSLYVGVVVAMVWLGALVWLVM